MPPLRHRQDFTLRDFSPDSRFSRDRRHDGKARILNLATRENIAVAHSSAVHMPDSVQMALRL